MGRTQLIDELKLLRKRHRNDKYATFETRWIDVLDAVICELEESSWHTGTPTEDGTFLVLWKDTEEPMRRFSVLHWNEYNDTWYDEETTYCNWGDEYHAEVIAWKKIEPYRG